MAEQEAKVSEHITSSSSNFIDILNNIGIEEGVRYETIVTTNGPHINAAAIGIRRKIDKFNLKIYEMSNTFENLQKETSDGSNNHFGINIIDKSQLDLLCNAALRGWGSPIPEFPPNSFEIVGGTPFLIDAHACIICELESTKLEQVKDNWGQSSRLDVKANIIDIIQKDTEEFKPITRSPEEPLLEALVVATRFKIAKGVMKDKCRNRVEELLEQAGVPNDVGRTLTMEALKEYFGIFD